MSFGIKPSPHPHTQHVQGSAHVHLPSDVDQLQVLVLRYKELVAAKSLVPKVPHGIQVPFGDTPLDQELISIKRVLDNLVSAQKLYESKRDKICKIKESRKLKLKLKSTANLNSDKNGVELLGSQLYAFALLSHDMDVPDETLQFIQKSTIDANSPTLNATLSDICVPFTTNFDGRVEMAGLPNETKLKSKSKPTSQNSKDSINSFEIATATGEQLISLKVNNRITLLEKIPSNITTFDVSQIDFNPPDESHKFEDILKTRALTELKSLRLLAKQKLIRQSLIFGIASKPNLEIGSIINRSLNQRSKLHTPQVARLTEQLELQQTLERERKESAIHRKQIRVITNHSANVRENSQLIRNKIANLSKTAIQYHIQIEKEEQRKLEKTAKQRLQALKANDEEAYIKLLDQTKDTRLTHLLKQTNAFLDSLAQAVKVQQAEVRDEDNFREGSLLTESHHGGEDDDEEKEKIDYYKVAHRVHEEIKVQPSILVGGTLKEYQIKGLEWMVSLYNNHLNGILADEMGLGKTIQSISLISYLIETKRQRGPYLVIVPLSTLTNWTLEFEKWAPSIKKIVYKGAPAIRKSFQNAIRQGDFQVLLTTYEYIIKDRPILSKLKWIHMIIDEGHRMKNAQSKLSATLTNYYHSQYRLILTGTPLQNNLPELWALLNFVLPKIFNSVKTFDDWFNTPFANTGRQEKLELTEEETLLIIRRLHKVLRPFLLRRLKKDVEKDLPDKVEKVVKCKLSALQSKLYEQMLKHNAVFVGDGVAGTSRGIKGLNNKVMQLRKICNHPFVFEEVENAIMHNNPYATDELWRVSGKFELLDRVLPKFRATNHRVLMFFQMTQIMDIMEDYLNLRGMKFLRLDGGTKSDDRSALLKEFNAPNSEYFCFLLSTRAGGLGLNLQTADTVIIYDTDWNPHQDLQAQDRAHRIGQKNEVRILRLITEDSVEEVILERAHKKLDIDGKVIQAGKFDNKSTAEEQEAFLRSLLEAEEAKQNQNGEDEDEDLDDDELNELLARNDDEQVLFKRMDKERLADKSQPINRLMTYDELPPVFKEDIKQHLEPVKNESLGRGARERKKVYYDDGLTDEQWLNAIDGEEEDGIEKAIEKKQRSIKKRRSNKTQRDESESNNVVDESRDSSLTPIETSTPPSKRKRSNTINTPSIDDNFKQDRSNKKKKHKKNSLLPDSNKKLMEEFNDIINGITNLTDSNGYMVADLFLELPDKTLYPDYYALIKEPISLDQIRQRLNNSTYNSTNDFESDFKLMFRNARIYNQEGSIVYENAGVIEEYVVERISQYKNIIGEN